MRELKRVILKLSGEALSGSKGQGYDDELIEDIARQVPLSQRMRPQWDEQVLRELGFSQIEIDLDVWKEVWSEVEKVNYGSTPMFCVKGIR